MAHPHPTLLLLLLLSTTTTSLFTSLDTLDLDGDSRVDGIAVIFSDQVNTSTFAVGDFSVDSGLSVLGFESLAEAGNSVTLLLSERVDRAYDGDVRPAVTYTRGSLLRLSDGLAFENETAVAADAVPPRVVALYPTPDSVEILVELSEPVAGALQSIDFGYVNNDAGGVTGLEGINDANGTDRLVALTLLQQYTSGQDTNDQIFADSTRLFDLNGVAASETPVNLADVEPPTLDVASIEHRDSNGNGICDQIIMYASHSVDDTSLNATDFLLSLDDGDEYEIISVDSGPLANDRVFVLYLNETGREPKTGDSGAFDAIAVINVTAADAWTDVLGLDGSNETVTAAADTLGPVVVSVVGRMPGAQVTVTLSEPVASVNASDLIYTDTNSDGADAVVGGPYDFSSGSAVITFNNNMVTLDFFGDSIRLGDAVTDAAGNAPPSNAQSVELFNDDSQPPSIVRIRTQDSDSDGVVDRLQVEFDEPVFDASVFVANWTLNTAGFSFVNSSTNDAFVTDQPEDEFVYLLINAPGGSTTDVAPSITYTAGVLIDSNGQALPSDTVQATDGAPPLLLSASTADQDGDGRLDHITLVFSEAVDDTSLDSTDGWNLLDGYQVDSIGTGDTANDTTIVLTISNPTLSALEGDTGVTPALHYNGSAGPIADMAGNSLGDLDGFLPSDNAGPAIVAVTGALPGDEIAVIYSEPLPVSPSLANLVLSAVDSIALDAIANHTGAVLTITTTSLSLEDFAKNGSPGSSLVSTASSPQDAAGNDPSTTTPVHFTNTDSTPPTIVRVVSLDSDGNGRIDGFMVEMDAEVRDPTVNSSLIAASDGFGELGSLAVLPGHPDVVEDSTLYFSVDELADINTTLTPTLTFGAGCLDDMNGNTFASETAVVSVDGMGPVIISATSSVARNLVTVTFSESVFSSSDATGTLTVASLVTAGALGADVSDVPDGDGSDSVATATVSDSFALGDFDDEARVSVRAGSSSCFDANGNACGTGYSVALENSDTDTPSLVDMATVDADTNGRLDAIELVFSEAMMDSSVLSSVANVSVAGYTVDSISTGDTSDDATFRVILTESGTPDTAARPLVSIDDGVFRDINNNPLPAISDFEPVDSAGPVVVSAVSQVRSTEVVITFSEPVVAEAGAGALLLTSVLLAPREVTAVVGDGSLGNATLTVDSPFVLADFGALVVSANASACVDLAEPPVAAPANPQQVTLSNADQEAPEFVSAQTQGDEGATWPTRIVLTFDEPIDPTSVHAANFTVSSPAREIASVSTDEERVTLELVDTTVTDTSVRPEVAYSQGLLRDINGNLAASTTRTSADGVAPRIISAIGDVGADVIVARFSERVVGVFGYDFFNMTASLDGLDFVQGANYTLGLNPVLEVVLPLTRTLTIDDMVATTLRVNADHVPDASGNFAAPLESDMQNGDPEKPELLLARFEDVDGNGRVDRVFLNFSEAIDGQSVHAGEFAVFDDTQSVQLPIESLDVGDTLDDATFWLLLSERTDGLYDTGHSLRLEYTQASLRDTSGNLLESVNRSMSDGAPAVLLEATTRAPTRVLRCVFSEPVFGTVNALGSLNGADFVYYDESGGGASTIDDAFVVDNVLGEEIVVEVTTTIDSVFTLQDFGVDGVGAAADAIFDGAGNPSRVDLRATVETTDATVPQISSVRSVDADGNGRIDQFVINFNEGVLDTSLRASEYVIDGYTITSASTGDLADRANINDPLFVFNVAEISSGYDTAATPRVQYLGSTTTDLNGNELAPRNITVTDGVAPVIVSVTGTAPESTLNVTFSEPVQPGRDASAFGTNAFELTSASGNSIASVSGDGADGRLTLQLASALTWEDFGTSSTTLAVALDIVTDDPTIEDRATPVAQFASTAAVQLTNTDTEAPVIVAAETQDSAGSVLGKIDRIQLTFSETILRFSPRPQDFVVPGYTVTGASANGLVVVLTLNEGAEFDTDATPLVTYNGVTTVDQNNNRVPLFSNYPTEDNAAPALVSASGGRGRSVLTVQFSEPVRLTANPSSSTLSLDMFQYVDGNQGGASGLFGFTDGDASDGSVVLTLTGALNSVDFRTDGDLISIGNGLVEDLAGNPVTTLAGEETQLTRNTALDVPSEAAATDQTALIGVVGALGGAVLIVLVIVLLMRSNAKREPTPVGEQGEAPDEVGIQMTAIQHKPQPAVSDSDSDQDYGTLNETEENDGAAGSASSSELQQQDSAINLMIAGGSSELADEDSDAEAGGAGAGAAAADAANEVHSSDSEDDDVQLAV